MMISAVVYYNPEQVAYLHAGSLSKYDAVIQSRCREKQQSHPCYNFPCKENEICEVNGDSYACTPDQGLDDNNGAGVWSGMKELLVLAFERSFISAAASGSKFVMADLSEPEVFLRINEFIAKLTPGQQYCLSFKYIIGGKPDSVFIQVGSSVHKSATSGWTSANYQFTDDYPMIMIFVYDEDSYGAIDDVTLSPGPCGNWNTL
ncbi:hypothetical protein FSP39_023392 [Pinctada imbricata]|uniref:Uncharacterized protein n=1 Tax=Pinctada imbricata TaxID=66713 RepID=A0AA89BXH7_PINIB|nr:hypothetical protein FSP39_023392 [Pinctada imbricata]